MFKVDAALLAGGLGVDRERAQAWVELAAERIADGSIPLCLIPGAADDPAIDIELTAVERNPVNVDGHRVSAAGRADADLRQLPAPVHLRSPSGWWRSGPTADRSC